MEHFIIVNGEHVPTTFECLNWVNAPDKVKKHKKVYRRIHDCRLIVIHTVHGRTCRYVKPGGKPSTRDLAWARSHWNSKNGASTDAYIDTDGSCTWANDPALFATWGASQVNPYAMHIEIVTDEDGTMYEASLDTLCELVTLLCQKLGIQMQTPWDHVTNEPYAGRIKLLDPEEAGRHCVGVVGHRNIWGYQKKLVDGVKVVDKTAPLTSVRGFGDPNSWPFIRLVEKCGFEKLSYHTLAAGQKEVEVLAVWRERQSLLFSPFTEDRDGVPLTKTVARLKEQGHTDGMWVKWNPTAHPGTKREALAIATDLNVLRPEDPPMNPWSSGLIFKP